MEPEEEEVGRVVRLPASDWRCLSYSRLIPTRCTHPACNLLIQNQQYLLEQCLGLSQRGPESVINFPRVPVLEVRHTQSQSLGEFRCPFENCSTGKN